ncbi:hypothetical protein Tdes44962_MAKER10539, partial [Teratosphaeria destructans]
RETIRLHHHRSIRQHRHPVRQHARPSHHDHRRQGQRRDADVHARRRSRQPARAADDASLERRRVDDYFVRGGRRGRHGDEYGCARRQHELEGQAGAAVGWCCGCAAHREAREWPCGGRGGRCRGRRRFALGMRGIVHMARKGDDSLFGFCLWIAFFLCIARDILCMGWETAWRRPQDRANTMCADRYGITTDM